MEKPTFKNGRRAPNADSGVSLPGGVFSTIIGVALIITSGSLRRDLTFIG